MTTTQYILLAVACVAYTLSQLQQHGKLSLIDEGFWGVRSWVRKYATIRDPLSDLAPRTWYYRFFKISYKERFPLSATLLVCLTDGYHLMQLIFNTCICLAVALCYDNWMLWFVIVRTGWGILFSLTYKLFSL